MPEPVIACDLCLNDGFQQVTKLTEVDNMKIMACDGITL